MNAGRVLTAILAFVLLALVALLAFVPGAGEEHPRGAFATQPSGKNSARLMLEALGFRPRVWTEAPGDLPRGAHLLLLGGVPEMPPGYGRAAESAGEEDALPRERVEGSRRLRDPLHYLRFLEEGGIALAPWNEELAEFLVDTLLLDGLAAVEAFESEEDAEAPATGQTAILASGERVELAWDDARAERRWFGALPLASPLEVAVVDDAGENLVLRKRVGRGAVLLVPSDDFMDNAHLAEAENAVLLVRLVESAGPVDRVLFDEYALGGWTPLSPIDLAFSPRWFVASAHVLVLLVAALWSVSWVRQFPRDPEPLHHASALVRARGHASFLASAGRWGLLARMLGAGVARRLGARPARAAGLGERNEADALEPETLRALVAPLASRLGAREAALAALFDPVTIDDERGLEERARRLLELERAAAR